MVYRDRDIVRIAPAYGKEPPPFPGRLDVPRTVADERHVVQIETAVSADLHLVLLVVAGVNVRRVCAIDAALIEKHSATTRTQQKVISKNKDKQIIDKQINKSRSRIGVQCLIKHNA